MQIVILSKVRVVPRIAVIFLTDIPEVISTANKVFLTVKRFNTCCLRLRSNIYRCSCDCRCRSFFFEVILISRRCSLDSLRWFSRFRFFLGIGASLNTTDNTKYNQNEQKENNNSNQNAFKRIIRFFFFIFRIVCCVSIVAVGIVVVVVVVIVVVTVIIVVLIVFFAEIIAK